MPSNENLYRSLQEAGYILIFKPVLEIKGQSGRAVKGNVDAELVLHAMIQYPNYDKAVIVTGDGDFACLVEYLHGQDKLKRVLSPSIKKSSRLLKKQAREKNRTSWRSGAASSSTNRERKAPTRGRSR